MDQSQAPLWEAIIKYANKSVVPFHTPGHKLRSGVFPSIDKYLGTKLWKFDASDEIEADYCDHDFVNVLQQAEMLASDLFQAVATKFLVNGTSGGIHAMLLSIHGKVLLPRFSHQSLYGGLILSRAEPIFLPTEIDSNWNVPLPPSQDLVMEIAIENSVEAIFLTSPTYYGTTIGLESLARFAKANNILLLIDEAHGGHFHFSSQLPLPALTQGADLVVQSTHKTLGSLTQTSMLHIANADLIGRIDTAIKILQTTSPSLVFLGVLDAVRKNLAVSGTDLVEKAMQLADTLRSKLEQIPGVSVVPPSIVHDSTKVVFNLNELGLSGIEVENLLRKNYNIQVELSDYYHVLVLVTVGDTIDNIKALINATKDLAWKYRFQSPLRFRPLPIFPIPERILPMYEAFAQPSELIRLEDAVGRIGADFLTPYPPGVPLVVPGELITKAMVTNIKLCVDHGWEVRGMTREMLKVIKE